MARRWRLLASLPLLVAVAGCSEPFKPVSERGSAAFEAALAVSGNQLAVAWYGNRNGNGNGNDDIYLRVLDAQLRPHSPELRLTADAAASYEADVVAFGDDLAIAWYDRAADDQLTAWLGLWNAQGELQWRQELSASTSHGRVPVLQRLGDALFVAWIEAGIDTKAPTAAKPAIHGAWLTRNGSFSTAPFRIASASHTTWNLNADTTRDNRVALVFDAAFDTQASELYLALIDRDGSTLTRLSNDDGFDSKYPDIAIGTTAAALSWHDSKDGNEEVYLALLAPALTAAAPTLTGLDAGQITAAPAFVDAGARRITATAGESIGAYLDWNGDTLGLAWNDNDSGRHQLWFQPFNPAGLPKRPPQQLTNTRANSMLPAIAAHRDGFVLAWGEVHLGLDGHDSRAGTTRSRIVAQYVE